MNWNKTKKLQLDPYSRVNIRDRYLNELKDEHDYILLTDSEEWLKEDWEILEGIHHLSERQTVYHKNKLDNSTAAELKIQDEAFSNFQVKCCKAFQILRERAYVFINLLNLMIVSDIEELQEKDINWLIEAMKLEMSEEQASNEFKKLIKDALTQNYRKFDNWFHVYNDRRKGQK